MPKVERGFSCLSLKASRNAQLPLMFHVNKSRLPVGFDADEAELRHTCYCEVIRRQMLLRQPGERKRCFYTQT
jgi:hypothetical protein